MYSPVRATILLKLFILLETIWHVQYILSARMEKVAFIMDIIATLPIHIYPCFVNAKGRVERIMTLLCLNRVLKIYKVGDNCYSLSLDKCR